VTTAAAGGRADPIGPGGREPAATTVVALAVTDFVAPLQPTGSLDASLASGLDDHALREGARWHARIQKRLAREHPALLAEVPLSLTLERPGFTLLVRGRLDVLLPGVVEEIKCSLQPAALLRRLALDPAHVFAQQLRMYAWMQHRLGGGVLVCRLRVVSLLDGGETLLDVPFVPEQFDVFVEARIEAHWQQHLRDRARAVERREIGKRLAFPFAARRPGQEALIERAAAALASGQRLLVQAPTGLGKTAALLHPALTQALRDNGRVFYATPRNSQHAVAEAYVRRLRAAGQPVVSLTLCAREKVCPQEEITCTPDACSRARGYYDRLYASGAVAELVALGCADRAAVAEVADRHQLCPFELALDAARAADVLIGDYNYALSPKASLHRFFAGDEAAGRVLLLVDEAHNLPARSADWFSPALDRRWLKELGQSRRRAGGVPPGRRLQARLRRCLGLLDALDGPHREVTVDVAAFLDEELRLARLLPQMVAEGAALGANHPLLQLHRQWSAFCTVLRTLGPTHRLTWVPPDRLQITCLDASTHLRARLAELGGALLFSATLKPFVFYARLAGLGEPEAATFELASPFPAAHRRVLVVPQISTRYRRRAAQVPRIADFLQRVLPLRQGNYLIFFPSFEFLEAVAGQLHLPGFILLCQPRRAAAGEIEAILQRLRGERGVVVLAVLGGSLAEGIDLPGEALIGCVVVGPPLPPCDLERQLARAHFDALGVSGEAYAYTFPAMARAVQAAGRVIRGADERGLLVFLDGRFLAPDYAACFPADWFASGPQEAVSSAILADVQAFWAAGGG